MTRAVSILKFIAFVVAVKFVQWSATQLNATWCQPPGIWGFISSFATSESAMCQALVQIGAGTGMMYSAIFVAAVGEAMKQVAIRSPSVKAC